jgi:signal peptidase I
MLSRRKTFCLAILLSALVGCNGDYNSGDRVLVFKPAYDADIGEPRRFEVVVFKFPPAPVDKGVPKNYIKRLLGLPGELLAIFFGQIFVCHPDPEESKSFQDPDAEPNELWRFRYMHVDSPASLRLFDMPGKFEIVRKPPEVMMAMRRIVNDNDFQPSDLLVQRKFGETVRSITKRWEPGLTSNWIPDDAKGFANSGKKDGEDWIRYQHITRPIQDVAGEAVNFDKPALITDKMDYNSKITLGGEAFPDTDWVGDLMLECQLTVVKPEGEFRMELSRGTFRYQARFDLASGDCSLVKMFKDKKEQVLAKKATRVKGAGEYNLRLANFDARLTLWVDDELPFSDGVDYPPPEIQAKGENLTETELLERRGPTKENDLEPASLCSRGADVKIHHLRLWRDTYYSRNPGMRDHGLRGPGNLERSQAAQAPFWRDPDKWGPIHKIQPLVMYVQPGHYICLGDNSPQSSDSRQGDGEWGQVPKRLLLGRALMVYFPLNRAGPIR